ncbi:hypothetical protein P2R53_15920 [Priestia megaterium]|jgi:hypothetical protein|nr:hypothetical protein [Priestia megaterium]
MFVQTFKSAYSFLCAVNVVIATVTVLLKIDDFIVVLEKVNTDKTAH